MSWEIVVELFVQQISPGGCISNFVELTAYWNVIGVASQTKGETMGS